MKVNEDDQEIGAYMFRRTVPSMHLAPADVRWMVCFRVYKCFVKQSTILSYNIKHLSK